VTFAEHIVRQEIKTGKIVFTTWTKFMDEFTIVLKFHQGLQSTTQDKITESGSDWPKCKGNLTNLRRELHLSLAKGNPK
jgi:hypothetical protein